MTNDYVTYFSWFNQLAMLGWALLLFSPKRWNWLIITTGIVIPIILGIAYAGLMLAHMSNVTDGGYNSLSQVKALLSNDAVLLAGWAHYLCFDLIVATLIARESDKAGIVRLVQIPILLGTFLYGPAGMVLFVLTYALWRFFFDRQLFSSQLLNRSESEELILKDKAS